jgi:uncharacterized membrane protein
MARTIYASFEDKDHAEKAVGALLDHGARDEDISLVRKAREDEREEDYDLSAKSGISTTTGADAGSGAAKGAGVGLGVGILAALTAVFLPGIGLVLGGGALAAALGGVAATTAGGAIVGAVTGYLKDQGVDEDMAQAYGETIDRGGALIAIQVPSGDLDEARAEQVLAKYEAGNVRGYDTRGTTTTDPYGNTGRADVR